MGKQYWSADRTMLNVPHSFEPGPLMPTFCGVCGGRKDANQHTQETLNG